ncbi:MAG TPA: lipid-A-disaccharide synthase [Chitinophagales bacterium]|nr:lipid-A-disaccharide synthase [Chitinophagales bacterium]
MKYFFITGEASGDLLASNVVRQLNEIDEAAVIIGTGGKYLEKAGVKLVLNIEKMAFMGLVEVVKNLFTIRHNFKIVQQSILGFQPDVIVLVDYPGFNLKMAKWAKAHGFKVVYYIAPKVWAWKESRAKLLKKYVDLLLVILPFEKEYFKTHEIKSLDVGHPILENIPPVNYVFIKRNIALLPGSRKQEIDVLLPAMLDAMSHYDSEDIVVAGLSEHGRAYYNRMIRGRATLVMDDIYHVLDESKLAIVASGTATLEVALMNVPQVVVYKMNTLTYWIAKRFVKIPYISLVNLILNQNAVPELIQNDFNVLELKKVSNQVLSDTKVIQDDYLRLRKLLGDGQTAKNAAKYIFDFAKKGD